MQDVVPAPAATAAKPHRAALLSVVSLDLALCIGLLALALALRLPSLMDVPAFTDETEEARRALDIALGRSLPVTNVASYIGAWHNYLMAVAMWLGGFDVLSVRGVTLVLGALTIPLVYALARELGLGRPGALLAAGLLAVNGAHAIVGGHIAWAHCTTGFYTTLAALLLLRGARTGTIAPIVGAGLAAGLAVQTHPTALLLLLPVAAYALRIARRRGVLGMRPVAGGILAFSVVLSPLVIYNLASGFDSVRAGVEQSAEYKSQGEKPFGVEEYPQNLSRLALGLGQVLASSFVEIDEALADPAVPVAAALAVAGLIWALRRGLWLIPLSLALTALLLPVGNPNYDVVTDSRYLLPLLPLLFIAQAGLLEELGRRALGRFHNGQAGLVSIRPPGRLGRIASAALVSALLALVIWSLVSPVERLRAYEADYKPYNSAIQSLADQVIALRRPGEPVLLDDELRLSQKGLLDNKQRILSFLLALRSVPSEGVDVNGLGPRLRQRGDVSALLVTVRTPRPGEIGLRSFTELEFDWGRPSDELKIRVFRLELS